MLSRAIFFAILCCGCDQFVVERMYVDLDGGGGSVADGGAGGMGGAGASGGGGSGGSPSSGGGGAGGGSGGTLDCTGAHTFNQYADADAVHDSFCWEIHELGDDGNAFSIESGNFRISPGDSDNYWYDAEPSVNAPVLYTTVDADTEFSFRLSLVVSYTGGGAMPAGAFDGGGIIVRDPNAATEEWLLLDVADHSFHGAFGTMNYTSSTPLALTHQPASQFVSNMGVQLVICREDIGGDSWRFSSGYKFDNETSWVSLDEPPIIPELGGMVWVGATAHEFSDGPQEDIYVDVRSATLLTGDIAGCDVLP